MIRVLLHDTCGAAAVDLRTVRRAVRLSLARGDVEDGLVNVAVVDDAAIHELNRRDLGHDYPTDVLSYLLSRDGVRVEGEIVVSIDTARREAERYRWAASDELLLYVVHGALHLAGFDDHADADKKAMRDAEQAVLAEFGLSPRYDADED